MRETCISSEMKFQYNQKIKTYISSVKKLKFFKKFLEFKIKNFKSLKLKNKRKNNRVKFQVFTVEMHLFSSNIPSKTLHLKCTSLSLNEHIIFI